MVSPHPDLERKFRNTKRLIREKKAHLISEHVKNFPLDYISQEDHDKLESVKPWMEYHNPEIRKIKLLRSLSPPILDRIIILCVDFSDQPSQISTSTIYNRFFSSAQRSLKAYYTENSYGKYVPIGEVHGWYRAPQPKSYYAGGNYGFGTYPNNAPRMVEDTINIARNDPTINWSYFDNDGDNKINLLVVVHAGSEAAATGNVNDIWAHVWGINTPTSINGINFSWYATTSEYISSWQQTQVTGIDSHEFGHLLGLPDLYTANTSGVGLFSIMGTGAWAASAGASGDTPTHFDAWSKYVLGYSSTIIDKSGAVSVPAAETNDTNYIYTTNYPEEYFIIENRQNTGFDVSLPANGLLIWKIRHRFTNDDGLSSVCWGVVLLQADGKKEIEAGIGSGDAGDSFPGSTLNRTFNNSTNPGTVLCYGYSSNFSLSNISDSSSVMSYNAVVTVTTGSIYCTTTPEGSNIFIDNTFTNLFTPSTLKYVNPGNHSIFMMSQDGANGCTVPITVVADQTATALCDLTPPVTTGSISCTSSPQGAQIFYDSGSTGYVTGPVPVILTNITAGVPHTVMFRLSGYNDCSQPVTVAAGATADASCTLTLTTGYLACITVPPGAQIWLDGTNTGQTTPIGGMALVPRNYTVMFRLTGYQDCTQIVPIVAGQTYNASCTLTPIGCPGLSCAIDPCQPSTIPQGTAGSVSLPISITGGTPSYTIQVFRNGTAYGNPFPATGSMIWYFGVAAWPVGTYQMTAGITDSCVPPKTCTTAPCSITITGPCVNPGCGFTASG